MSGLIVYGHFSANNYFEVRLIIFLYYKSHAASSTGF